MASNVYIVTASSASIRQDASLQSTELRIVYKGQKLQCSKSKNNWYYTSTFKGYIQKVLQTICSASE